MNQIPDQVGPYRILRRLGAGGMGEVYLADDTRLFRRVALKRITNGEKDHGRLLQEARAAARLNHPGIASVYDVLETEEDAYIVMEYVDGQTLDRSLYGGGLPFGEVLAIGGQLAAALAEAHRLGVIHRDLKPANIARTESGQVKILDFGLAKRRHDVGASSAQMAVSSEAVPAGTVMGSPPYIPPEHFRGQPIGERGDIYSLGVTLFELLTGKRPFVGRESIEIMAAVLTSPTPRVRDFRPSVPESLNRLVLRAMARKPEDRFASAAELRDAVHLVEAEVSGATSAMPSWWSSWQSRRRRPMGWRGASFASALAAVVAIGVYARVPKYAPSDEGSPVIAVMPLSRAGADPQEEALGTGVADVLTTSLSKISGVTVIPRSSLADVAVRDPASLGRSVGATAVVSGSFQKVENRVRLVVQITRPGSKALAWSETFDGSMEGIFALQGDIATAVARALHLRTTPAQEAELQSPPTRDPQAFADYSLGVSFMQRTDLPGNVDRAIERFESAIGSDRRFARAYAGAGYAYWRRFVSTHEARWADKARETTMEALRLDPRDIEVRCTLARIYMGTGHQTEAEDELRRVLADSPDKDTPHLLLGQILLQVGNREGGLAELRNAIALRPNYWSHHQELGVALYRMGRYAEAAACFQRVTELQPDNSRGFQMLGMVWHASGDRTRALANYNRALELAPDAVAYTNVGLLHYEEKRFAEAASAFEKAASLDPRSAVKQRNLGDIYRRLGRESDAKRAYGRARDLIKEALQVNPSDASAMATLALCEAKLGDFNAALRDVEAASLIAGAGPDVLYKKAVVLVLSGREQNGLRALGHALRAGYSVKFMELDDDIASLRATEGYQTLVASTAAVGKKRGEK